MTPEQIDRAARRTAGIAALRRIRRLVDEDNTLEAWRSRWALRISILFLAVATVILAWGFIRA